MESRIKIKACADEMNRFFESNDVCSVRYFERIKTGLYKTIIRHAERKKYLRGTYTIAQVVKKLNNKERGNA